jgi:hypothetical protein
MDISSRGSIDEGHGRKFMGSIRKGSEIIREHKHPSTGRMDHDHFGV